MGQGLNNLATRLSSGGPVASRPTIARSFASLIWTKTPKKWQCQEILSKVYSISGGLYHDSLEGYPSCNLKSGYPPFYGRFL